jgi:hypothetical protein
MSGVVPIDSANTEEMMLVAMEALVTGIFTNLDVQTVSQGVHDCGFAKNRRSDIFKFARQIFRLFR